ncbi:MAG: hypothetical protein PHV68_03965 [Candidatus Gastranaerophilales bacterium]|nr:hypothetical protein [Candidatus Gastranaerophilales bacterium]
MIKPVSSISNNFVKLIKKAAESKTFEKHFNKCIDNPTYATRVLILTNVSKDTFAYALRVKNGLTNKEMPEEKKKYVVAMDAAMGGVTTVAQIATGWVLSSPKVLEKATKKLFGHLGENSKRFKQARAGFVAVSTLVFSMLLAKRVVVPLLAGPMADKIKISIDKSNPTKLKNNSTEKYSGMIPTFSHANYNNDLFKAFVNNKSKN